MATGPGRPTFAVVNALRTADGIISASQADQVRLVTGWSIWVKAWSMLVLSGREVSCS